MINARLFDLLRENDADSSREWRAAIGQAGLARLHIVGNNKERDDVGKSNSFAVTPVSVATFKSNIPLLLVDSNSYTPSDYKSGQFSG